MCVFHLERAEGPHPGSKVTVPCFGNVGQTGQKKKKRSSDLCIAQFIGRGQAGIWDSSAENALSQGGCRTSVSTLKRVGGSRRSMSTRPAVPTSCRHLSCLRGVGTGTLSC